jgi:bis(5'-nucleosyl)-tetraphosphatase (symmetrical)
MSTYVFGDIQGCFDELQSILAQVAYDEARDQLWFVGDLINRGEKNLETLNFVMSQKQAVTVLGNHDLHFLAVATGCHKPSSKDTFSDLLESENLPEIVDWLRHRPLIHHDRGSGFTMVHAGIPPIWDLDTCIIRATEVETMLQGKNFRAFLREMYGDQPYFWDDDLIGMARLRMITNYFTRMRFCTADGILELTHKTLERPEGFSPWFELPQQQEGQEMRILFGHWAALEGLTGTDSALALDTGCVWGRHLTAFRLEDGKYFRTPSETHQ